MEKIKEIAEKLKRQREDWQRFPEDTCIYTLYGEEAEALIKYIEEKEKPRCFTCKDSFTLLNCAECEDYSNWQPNEEANKP